MCGHSQNYRGEVDAGVTRTRIDRFESRCFVSSSSASRFAVRRLRQSDSNRFRSIPIETSHRYRRDRTSSLLEQRPHLVAQRERGGGAQLERAQPFLVGGREHHRGILQQVRAHVALGTRNLVRIQIRVGRGGHVLGLHHPVEERVCLVHVLRLRRNQEIVLRHAHAFARERERRARQLALHANRRAAPAVLHDDLPRDHPVDRAFVAVRLHVGFLLAQHGEHALRVFGILGALVLLQIPARGHVELLDRIQVRDFAAQCRWRIEQRFPAVVELAARHTRAVVRETRHEDQIRHRVVAVRIEQRMPVFRHDVRHVPQPALVQLAHEAVLREYLNVVVARDHDVVTAPARLQLRQQRCVAVIDVERRLDAGLLLELLQQLGRHPVRPVREMQFGSLHESECHREQ
ncbi:hypothetical protein Y023_5098 [Burkholderia pseudomallei A79D]|nr:hypothetical protein Y023_5098 [Burkholderia pseudomallei A79D]KGX97314.1 hypothetical protein X997_4781 [Burkholderia pseudomallei A79C]